MSDGVRPRRRSRSKSRTPSSENSVHCNAQTGEDGMARPRSHLLVLVHGFLGSSADWINFKRHVEETSKGNEFVILIVSRNGGWTGTMDGIENGARRAFEEVMLKVTEHEATLEQISITGHSLGGLYARYLAHLLDKEGVFEKLSPAVFTTLATPHLGVRKRQNTPFNVLFQQVLPVLKTTRELGIMDKDVLLHRMAIEEDFLRPLRKFHKRALYANVYHDVQVPYQTASLRYRNPYTSSKSPVRGHRQDDEQDQDAQKPEGELQREQGNSPSTGLVPGKVSVFDWLWRPSLPSFHRGKPSACSKHSKQHPNITQWSLDHRDKRRHWSTAQYVEPGVLTAPNEQAFLNGEQTLQLQLYDAGDAFHYDAKRDLLRMMMYKLDIDLGGWERYDVSFNGFLAHENIINKKAYMPGKSVVTHFARHVLIPAHLLSRQTEGASESHIDVSMPEKV